MASITVDSLQVLITANAKDLDEKLSKIASDLNGTGKSADKFSKMGTLAFGAVAGAAAALANKGINMITNSIDGAIKRVDTLNNAPKVLQNLGFSAEEAAKAIVQIDKGTRGLPTSLDGIAASLVSIASASGLGMEEATELTVAFNNMALAGGKGPAEAERALTQFTQALGRGKFQAQDFNTLMEVMPAQLQQVAKSLLGSSASTMQLRDALTSGEVSMDDFNSAVMELDKKGGEGFASFADQAKTATGGIGTGWSLVQTSITRGIANIIKAFGAGDITKAFGSMRDNIDKIFKSISGVVSFVKGNEFLSTFFKNFAIAIGIVTAAFIAWNIVLAINPIVLIATAIIAFIALIVTVGEKLGWWTAIWQGLQVVFNNVKTALQPLIDAFVTHLWPILQQLGEFIGGVFKKAWDSVTKAFKDLMKAIEPFMPVLKAVGIALLVSVVAPIVAVVAAVVIVIAIFTALATAIAWVVGKIAEYISFMVDNFKKAWEGIKLIFSNPGEFFRQKFEEAKDKAASAFLPIVKALSQIWENIKAAFNSVGRWFSDTFNAAKNLITNINWGQVGMDIIRGIGNGIAGMGKWLADKAVAAVNKAKDAIKSFFGIHSPSRVMRDEVGKMIGAGMAIGIDDSSKDVMSSMKDLANVSMGSFDSSVSVNHGFSDFVGDGTSQPLIVNIGGERIIDTVVQGINGRSFLNGASVINV